jgi:hypothetical protein
LICIPNIQLDEPAFHGVKVWPVEFGHFCLGQEIGRTFSFERIGFGGEVVLKHVFVGSDEQMQVFHAIGRVQNFAADSLASADCLETVLVGPEDNLLETRVVDVEDAL